MTLEAVEDEDLETGDVLVEDEDPCSTVWSRGEDLTGRRVVNQRHDPSVIPYHL